MTRIPFHVAVVILVMVIGATVGETLISAAMNRVGDLDVIRKERGLGAAIAVVVRSPFLIGGIACMAISFFSLLSALSTADLSLVGPATNSLTFIATAVSARFFLRENVDRRRWFAALLVAGGVYLLAR